MFFSVSPLGTIFMRPPSNYGDGYETNLQQHLYVLTLVEDVSLAWNPYKNKENLDYIQYYDGNNPAAREVLMIGYNFQEVILQHPEKHNWEYVNKATFFPSIQMFLAKYGGGWSNPQNRKHSRWFTTNVKPLNLEEMYYFTQEQLDEIKNYNKQDSIKIKYNEEDYNMLDEMQQLTTLPKDAYKVLEYVNPILRLKKTWAWIPFDERDHNYLIVKPNTYRHQKNKETEYGYESTIYYSTNTNRKQYTKRRFSFA